MSGMVRSRNITDAKPARYCTRASVPLEACVIDTSQLAGSELIRIFRANAESSTTNTGRAIGILCGSLPQTGQMLDGGASNCLGTRTVSGNFFGAAWTSGYLFFNFSPAGLTILNCSSVSLRIASLTYDFSTNLGVEPPHFGLIHKMNDYRILQS